MRVQPISSIQSSANHLKGDKKKQEPQKKYKSLFDDELEKARQENEKDQG